MDGWTRGECVPVPKDLNSQPELALLFHVSLLISQRLHTHTFVLQSWRSYEDRGVSSPSRLIVVILLQGTPRTESNIIEDHLYAFNFV